ncbi:MAG: hypothetical protein IKC91_03035 [Clostridia bacterium]|nr:hypothetical protein [Clostridia bacterium]
MNNELLKKAYKNYLNTLNIHTLRNVARGVGVYSPTKGKKDDLIDRTIAVLIGTVEAVSPSNLGAPLKEDSLDPKYLRELDAIGREYTVTVGQSVRAENVLSVRSGEPSVSPYDQPLYMGVLELLPNGSGYLRVKNCQTTAGKDVFVSLQSVRSFALREGDYVVGYADLKSGNSSPVLTKVLSVNTRSDYQKRKSFEDFSACHPEEKIQFSKDNQKLCLRYIDLFAPVGKGQRVLVKASTGTDANGLLKDVARALKEKINNGENYQVLPLLIDERPEEVTEFRRIFPQELAYTTFDQSPAEHLQVAKLTFARAKRLAEMGEDVVVLFNSLTRLTYACDACATAEKTLACGLNASAFTLSKSCLSQAVKLKNGGSITVIAVLSAEEGNALDQAIAYEYEKICNCVLSLDKALAQKGKGCVLNVQDSYTVRAESLLSVEEAECAAYIRSQFTERKGGDKLYALMQQSKDNASFIQEVFNN